jgi:hypothetical protein
MVHVKRTVGYVQIALGMMLIFACFILPGMAIKKQQNKAEEVFGIMDDVIEQKYNELNITISEKENYEQMRLRSTVIFSMLITNHAIIYASMAIIFVLAIMMIFQGVANTRIGSEDDVSSSELGKFVITIFLMLYVITAAYITFFEGSRKEILGNSIVFLVILAAFAGIIYLFRYIIKKIEAKKANAEQKKL